MLLTLVGAVLVMVVFAAAYGTYHFLKWLFKSPRGGRSSRSSDGGFFGVFDGDGSSGDSGGGD